MDSLLSRSFDLVKFVLEKRYVVKVKHARMNHQMKPIITLEARRFRHIGN